MCVPHAPLKMGMEPSHHTGSPFQFWIALRLSCCPDSSWRTEQPPCLPRLGARVPQHWLTLGMGTWSSTFPKTVESHFPVSFRTFKIWVGSRRGDDRAYAFSGPPAYVCGEASWQGEPAALWCSCYQSGIWILAVSLFQRKAQAQKSTKQLIKLLSWPGNQTDRFRRELRPSGIDCGREG